MASQVGPNLNSLLGQSSFTPMLELFRDEVVPALTRLNQGEDVEMTMISSVLDSSSAANLCFASLKNAPYFLTEAPSVSDSIKARLRYLEVGVMSIASLVQNVVLAVIATIAAAVTLGQIKAVNDFFKREWVHTALSAVAIPAGFAGAIAPTLGLGGNLLMGAMILPMIASEGQALQNRSQRAEEELFTTINDVYQRNRPRFENALRELVGNDEMIFAAVVRPALDHIDENFPRVHTGQEFLGMMRGAVQRIIQAVQIVPAGGQQPQPNQTPEQREAALRAQLQAALANV